MNNHLSIPHHLIVENIFPFLFSHRDMEAYILNSIITENMNDLFFLVGRSSASVPSYITSNEEYAQRTGFTIVLPILVSLGFKLSAEIFEAAATKGNLEIMKWLKKMNCPWNAWVFYYATEHDSLDNMKWLKENGCPWNGETFVAAVRNGNLDNLKWLKENGCPVDSRTFYYAAEQGDPENLNWLKENFEDSISEYY